VKKLLILLSLLMPYMATAQTLFLNESSVVVPAPHRGGVNLGSFTSYDSGQMFKNLLRGDNWNFEPTQLHQIFALTSNGTATSFNNTNQYDVFAANAMAGATVTVVDSQSGGAELGCLGTVIASTTGNGSTAGAVYTINPTTNQGNAGCAAPFTTGDIVLVYQNQFPSAEACWETTGNCDIAGSVANGGRLTTDSTTPYDGQQSLVLDVTAGTSATATARFYFDNNSNNIFVLLNGSYSLTGFIRQYSGAVTPLQITVTTPSGLCSGTIASPMANWAPFSIACTFNETSNTTPANHWISLTAAGAEGLGAIEIDDIGFQKTNAQDPTNPTVFRDETVAALRTLCATGTAGPSCLIRNWTNQNGETTANWTASPGQAAMTYASSAYSASGEITPQLQEYLSLVQLVGGQPYLVFPCTATTTDATDFIDYMSSTDTSTGFGLNRANQGQVAPWIGTGGVFKSVWVSFCNESWNGSSFIGQGLPFRGSAGTQFYFDYANRAKDIFSAMRNDANFTNGMLLGFNLEMLDNSQLDLSDSIQLMASSAGAPDYLEIAPYTQSTVSNWQTDAGLWQSAMEEPWGNVSDPASSSTFYQNVHLIEGLNTCGPTGKAACAVTVYEEADSSLATCGLGSSSACLSPTYMPIDQTHEDYITAGAGQGVIAPLQLLLNQEQLGITAQNYFSLAEFENGTLAGSLATLAKLWGCTVDMGGSTSYLNQEEYTFRPACLGLIIANQSIIGPEYSAQFASGLPTYNWPGDPYNGPTHALSNVPYLYAFCFMAESPGTARSCVFINTSLNNPYTITFASTSVPFGSCTTRQFAPGSIDDLNEAPSNTPTNNTAATVGITTSTQACSSSLTLPVNSITALDFTSSGFPAAEAPVYSESGGTYISGQLISITDATPDSTIYYTTDGSTPTISSSIYSAPIPVAATETLNSIAIANGYSPSAVGSAAYTIITPATPSFSPNAGTYKSPITVTISDSTANTTIYYTTDGSTPNNTSNIYVAPIPVNATETLKAVAIAAGNLSGAVGSASYTISGATPSINYATGFTTTGINLYGATISNGVLQLTNGGTAESNVAWFNTTENIQAFTTDFIFQNTDANANGFTFAIQNAPAGDYAVGGNGSSLGYAGISRSVAIKFDLYNSAGEGSDSTGFYTNGAIPAVPAIDMSSSGVDLHSPDILQAHVTYDGINLTMTLTDTVTQATFSASTVANIPSVVGANKAYVGFTASTGALTAIQNVLSWTFVPNVVTPAFSVSAGTYINSQSVAISDGTTGATIYYTTDGSIPSTSSSKYSLPVTISKTETLNAMAVAANYVNSAVASAAYTINGAATTPTFSPASGAYGPAQQVTISDTTAGSAIYYTLDGSSPTSSSTLYAGPINVSASETVNAIAVAALFANSPVGSASYTINGAAAKPTLSLSPGTYGGTQFVTVSDSTPGADICYTTDGTTPSNSSTVYTGPIAISSSETLNAIAIATNYSNSSIATATYVINGPTATPIFSIAPGSYGPAQSVSISDSALGAVIYYSIDGTIPTSSSAVYVGPVLVNFSETISAIAIAPNYANSLVTTAIYIINGAAATPSFSPIAGTYNTAQTVTISDTTSGAAIYYTTDGSVPTDSSTLFTSPVTVSSTQTLNAVAIAPNYLNSAIAMAAYIISVPAATPAFSPAAGSYALPQTVNMSDTTPGAAIYYTADGSLPTSSSTLYSVPITVSSSETLNAIAVAMGYTNSLVGSAAYAINGATNAPLFSPAPGAYPTGQTVVISDASSGAAIYYTTDGTTPSESSTRYSGPLQISGTQTLSAIAIARNYGLSAVTTGVYTIYTSPVGNLEQAIDASTGSTTIASTDVLFVSGWAADPTDGSPLQNVKVFIDGVFIGVPTLSIPRPDVASYFNDPAYLNSGLSLTYPASSIAVGTHTVTVIATNLGGVSTTLGNLGITVIAPYPAPVGNLEQAIDASNGSTNVAASDILFVSGWVADPIDGSPLTNVQVLMDGTSVGTPTLGIARPDVASYFNNPAYANSGFTLYLAPNSLVTGTHSVTVAAVNSHGVRTTLGPENITVIAGSKEVPPIGNLETAIDSVNGTSTISQSSGTLFVSGWAADYQDNGPANAVQILIDGTVAGLATLGESRPDVAAYFNNPAWANTGYQFSLPATGLTMGTHFVTAVATDSLNLSTSFGPLTVTIAP